MVRGAFLILVLAAVLAASSARAQEAVGDWLGAIDAGGAKLRIAVHIHKDASGALVGTLDSLDQGAAGLPLANITVANGSLAFETPVVRAAYRGQWDAATGAWVGQWRQGQALPLTLTRGEAKPAPVIAGLDGEWQGVLEVGGQKLHLVLRVRTGPLGTTANLDSPDQLAYGIPVSALSRNGEAVDLTIASIGGSLAAKLAPDGQSMAGMWKQGAQTIPLTLTRRPPGERPAAMKRPQTPKPPFPYRDLKVTFTDPRASITLAGDLTEPAGAGPFPAVVLIAGSGPQSRNEVVLGHQIFLVLADRLTRAGFAVLRYDKRGVGESGGDYASATTMDFADDAQAAAAWLGARPEIDMRRVGLIGHSEGGLVAPIVAARDRAVAFIVLLAPPGVDGETILHLQGALIAKVAGAPDATVARNLARQDRVFAAIEDAPNSNEATAKATAVIASDPAAAGLPPEALKARAEVYANDWMRFFLTYDPVPTLEKVRCPVLALWGSNDLQVPPAEDVPPVRAALARDRDVTIAVLPSLNHLFQTATTGSITEYATIEETFAPSALDRIVAWLTAHTGRTR